MRLPRFRVRTLMLAVGVVALLIWGAMLGTRSYVYYRLARTYGTYEPMAGNGRQGSRESYAYAEHSGEMGSADCRILRAVGTEVSPSYAAPLDACRTRSSRARFWAVSRIGQGPDVMRMPSIAERLFLLIGTPQQGHCSRGVGSFGAYQRTDEDTHCQACSRLLVGSARWRRGACPFSQTLSLLR